MKINWNMTICSIQCSEKLGKKGRGLTKKGGVLLNMTICNSLQYWNCVPFLLLTNLDKWSWKMTFVQVPLPLNSVFPFPKSSIILVRKGGSIINTLLPQWKNMLFFFKCLISITQVYNWCSSKQYDSSWKNKSLIILFDYEWYYEW